MAPSAPEVATAATAATAVEASAAERHRAAQAALVSTLADLIARAWSSLLDPHDLRGSTPRLATAVEAIVKQYGRAGAAAALREYRIQRRAAGLVGRPVLRMPPLPPVEQITKTVEWAVSDLYGPVTPDTLTVAEDRLTASTEQLVLNQSRNATITAVERDREAKGWARVPEPDACAFCALLATRGAVYHDEDTAGRDANKDFTGAGQFKFHDHCRCHVEPVFTAYEPSHQIRQWQGEHAALKKEHDTVSLNMWRQHYEGRPVTRKARGSGARHGETGHDPSRDVDASRTVAQLEHTLAQLEHSLTKHDTPGARKRVEELRRKIAARKQ